MENYRNDKEYDPGALGILGGFCIWGGVLTAPAAAVGEIAEMVGIVDNYPGGLLGRITIGLGVMAAGLISADHVNQKN